MQLLDFGAHLRPQLGVEVGQRLVEQEDVRMADDGAAHATRWRWPPDSCAGRRSINASSPRMAAALV